jgi:hypothetical protein
MKAISPSSNNLEEPEFDCYYQRWQFLTPLVFHLSPEEVGSKRTGDEAFCFCPDPEKLDISGVPLSNGEA